MLANTEEKLQTASVKREWSRHELPEGKMAKLLLEIGYELFAVIALTFFPWRGITLPEVWSCSCILPVNFSRTLAGVG